MRAGAPFGPEKNNSIPSIVMHTPKYVRCIVEVSDIIIIDGRWIGTGEVRLGVPTALQIFKSLVSNLVINQARFFLFNFTMV
jgi:hypothetical protein